MHDIDFTKNPASVFQFKDKKQTLTQYYKAGYNLVVKEQRQPLIVYQQKRRNCRGELPFPYGSGHNVLLHRRFPLRDPHHASSFPLSFFCS